MAFNVMSFLGGAAGAGSKFLDDKAASKERDRLTKQQQQWQIATEGRQDARTRKLKREERSRQTDELAGLLESLNYDPNNIKSIMSRGNTAAQFWVETGKDALALGEDPNSLLKTAGGTDPRSQEVATQTIDEIKVPEVPAVINDSQTNDAIPTSDDTTDTNETSVALADGFTINVDAWSNMFGAPEPEAKTANARLTWISRQVAKNPNHKSRPTWEIERARLLLDIADVAEAGREKDGKGGDGFGLGTVVANINEVRRGSLTKQNFKVGIDNAIIDAKAGDLWKASLADLDVAKELTTRNSGVQSEGMKYAIKGIHESAVSELAQYGWEKYYAQNSRTIPANQEGQPDRDNKNFGTMKTAQSIEEFEKNANGRMYRAGDPVKVMVEGGGFILVMYTGIPNAFDNNNLFVGLTRPMNAGN